MHLALWYVVFVCHQYDVCENSVGSVYIGGYGGLSEIGLCVFHELCLVKIFGVFVYSVMWSELLMTSAISCPLWSPVYECHKVECAFTSPMRTDCGMFVMGSISVSAVL